MNHVNYFYPYSKSNNHEDNLTRAFLALLNLIPSVQAVFIDLIRDRQIKEIIFKGLERHNYDALIPSYFERDSKITRVETQKSHFGSDKGIILSILISDEKLQEDVKVEASERSAVYDGIITYETREQGWIFIVENKPNIDKVWNEQLKPSIKKKIDDESSFKIIDYPISLEWKNIIDALYGLIVNDIATQGEKGLINQFFDYVNSSYSQLNPYDTFEKCQDREVLLQKRCEQIMGMFTSEELGKHRGWKAYFDIKDKAVKRGALFPQSIEDSDWKICLAIYPGDTVSQARNFYQSLSSNDGISELINTVKSYGWNFFTNLHFSFISSHLYWARREMENEDYLGYWVNNRSEIKQHKELAGSFGHVYNHFLDKGLITEDDRKELISKFDRTNRSTMNICPGVGFEKYWNKKEVLKLEADDKDGFAEEVKEQLNTIISCWSDTRLKLIA